VAAGLRSEEQRQSAREEAAVKILSALALAVGGLALLAGLRVLVSGAPALGMSGLDVAGTLAVLFPALGPLAGLVGTLVPFVAALFLARLSGLLSRLGLEKLDRPWALACDVLYVLACLVLLPLLWM
jgi:hypothetical protein